jgi:hypothetical protein
MVSRPISYKLSTCFNNVESLLESPREFWMPEKAIKKDNATPDYKETSLILYGIREVKQFKED